MRPGPTHREHRAEAEQHQVCLGWKKVDSLSLTPPHQALDARGRATGARRSSLARTPRVYSPRPAEPHPIAACQSLRLCRSGQRTHPSPTTTHLMACMGAGKGGGGGRGREPSCGEMPGAAAAADPNAERAAGDSRVPPSAGCEDSRVCAGGAGQGANCSGGGAPAGPWTEGPHPETRTWHEAAQVGFDATELDARGSPSRFLPGTPAHPAGERPSCLHNQYRGGSPSCLVAIEVTQ